jgi:hypothetical protein
MSKIPVAAQTAVLADESGREEGTN